MGGSISDVRLSRKHDDYVCYDFETISGGTAEEGTDYLKFPKATYWMQIGKRVDKPFVRIIDDSVNDNGETVKVKISNARLCNDASQTLSITRAEATGTIRNTDPLPPALKARFGRTVARAGGGGQETVLNFAHFANGNGTTSDLVFVNVSTRPSGPGLSPYHAVILPSRPTLYFYDQEGNLLDPASVVDLTGDLVVTEDGALSIQTEMEPLGELTISTHGRGELVSGSVKVVSEGPLGGVLRYALPGIGVTGVGASPPVQDALFPVRQEGGLDTAAAIRNLSESDLVVTCRLMKEGAVLEETEIPLAANGQESQYIEEMFTFTGADVSDFVGIGASRPALYFYDQEGARHSRKIWWITEDGALSMPADGGGSDVADRLEVAANVEIDADVSDFVGSTGSSPRCRWCRCKRGWIENR